MAETFTVACTDRGRHGRITVRELTVSDDGTITERRDRQAPVPWPEGAQINWPEGDGTATTYAAPDHHVAYVPTAREDHPAGHKWRFVCAKCGRDVPLAPASLATIVAGFLADDRRVLDLSLLPN